MRELWLANVVLDTGPTHEVQATMMLSDRVSWTILAQGCASTSGFVFKIKVNVFGILSS